MARGCRTAQSQISALLCHGTCHLRSQSFRLTRKWGQRAPNLSVPGDDPKQYQFSSAPFFHGGISRHHSYFLRRGDGGWVFPGLGTTWDRGVKLIFTRGHISLVVAFKGLNVILGLYKCNYSLTRGKELGTAAG